MRISIVGPVYPYRGGISHYTAMLAHALIEAGHCVQVVSFKRQYPAWLYPGASDRDPSQQPIRTTAEYLLDPLQPWTWLNAAGSIRAFEADLVAIQWWTTFWGPAFSLLSRRLARRGQHVVYMIHNVLPHEQRRFDRPLARLALSGARDFIVQTPREGERLQELLPRAQPYSCPLPPYHLLHSSGPDRLAARKKLNLPPTDYLLLFFGFVRPYKGVHVLLQALGRLHLAGQRPHLAIVGEFWHDREHYLAEIEALGLAAQVHIADRYIPDEQIGDWFAAADCLVAAYLAGTQSAAAGIALAYGLPLIASQGIADGIAAENREALLEVVPPGDVEALAQAIARGMQTPPSLQPPIAGDNGWQQLVRTLVLIAGKEPPV